MKKAVTLIWLITLTVITLHAQDFAWAKAFKGGNTTYAQALTIDGSGNIYVTGKFSNTVDFDPGTDSFKLSTTNSDTYIAKLDADGNFIWVVSFTGSHNGDWGMALTTDAQNNVYATGTFTNTVDFDPGAGVYNLASHTAGTRDVFICKLNSSGSLVWAKNVGGTNGIAGNSIAVDGTGSVYVAGTFWGTSDFNPDSAVINTLSSPGNDDAYILKLNASGNFDWVKHIGNASAGGARSLHLDANSNVYVTGSFIGTVDFNPNAVDTFNLTSAGSGDAYALKLSSAGNFIWAKALGGPNSDYGKSIYTDAAGTSYITGAFSTTADFDSDTATHNSLVSAGDRDVFICKLDASGNLIWAKGIGGSWYDDTEGIKADAAGNVYTAGYFNSDSIDANPDTAVVYSLIGLGGNSSSYISKLNSNGEFVEAICIPRTVTYGLALDASSNTYTAGTFNLTIDFNPHPTDSFNITTVGVMNGFVLRLGNVALPSAISEVEELSTPVMFPNPAQSQLTVTWHGQLIENIYLTDMQGRVLKTEASVLADTYRLNIQDTPAGFYLLQINAQGSRQQLKLIKQ